MSHIEEFAILFTLAVGAAVVVVVNDWTKRRAVAKAEREGRKPKEAWVNNKSSWSMVIGVIFVMSFVYFLIPYYTLPEIGFASVLLVLAGLTVLLAGSLLIGLLLLRSQYRFATRVVHRAQSGDVEGAILETKRQIARRKPSKMLWNMLGGFYTMQELWEEAFKAFEQAEQIDPNDKTTAANKAMVLRRLRELEEGGAARPDAP